MSRGISKLQRLAKKAGIRGYQALTKEELILAISVEGKDRPGILSELQRIDDWLRKEAEIEERESFMEELKGL